MTWSYSIYFTLYISASGFCTCCRKCQTAWRGNIYVTLLISDWFLLGMIRQLEIDRILIIPVLHYIFQPVASVRNVRQLALDTVLIILCYIFQPVAPIRNVRQLALDTILIILCYIFQPVASVRNVRQLVLDMFTIILHYIFQHAVSVENVRQLALDPVKITLHFTLYISACCVCRACQAAGS
jgi:hypothetical protein